MEASMDTGEADRLDSWKEIAAYLNCSLRTVYRWEKNEGLPVHRHVHKKQSTVYAYRSEIDAWRAKRRPNQTQTSRRLPFWRAKTTVVPIAAGTGLILLLGLAGLILTYPFGAKTTALDFQAQDWVLVSTFDNRTGEEIFDGTLKAALERELVNSPHALVVPQERVDDSLRLMRMPLDAKVDAELGREICRRDGGIRALITGRVEKIGATYLLSMTVVDPFTGVQVSSVTDQARDQDEVVPAMGRLSNWVRANLGESLASVGMTNDKLEKATTPSLRALQLYTKGMALGYLGGRKEWERAVLLFNEAVKDDPTFASAHVFLGWAITNRRTPPSRPPAPESLPHLQQAMDLAETASYPERLFIQGTHEYFQGDDERACNTFRTLADLFPAHYWGVNNAATTCSEAGRHAEAIPYWVKTADLRPRSIPRVAAAARKLASAGKWSEAREYIERARRLMEDPSAEPLPSDNSFYGLLRVLPAMEHWQQGDLAQARDMVNKEAKHLEVLSGARRDSLRGHLARFFMTLGQLDAARELIQLLPAKDRYYFLAQISYVRQDHRALRNHVLRDLGWYQENLGAGIERDPLAWLLLARASLVAELRNSLPESVVREDWPQGSIPVSVPGAGEVDLRRLWHAEGGPAEIWLLRNVTAHYQRTRSLSRLSGYLLAAEMLAHSLEARGDLAGAVEALEEASRGKEQVEHWAGPYWLRVQHQLARTYRQLGDLEKSETIEAELLRLLSYADRDHPILVEIQGRGQLKVENTVPREPQ